MRCHALHQLDAVLAKAQRLVACAVALPAHQLEHAAPAHQRRIERLALDQLDAGLAQPVVVGDVARPGHHLQPREMLACQLRHRHALVDIVDGQHQHPSLAGAGGAQQVQPRRIAVEHLPAEAAHRFHLVGVVLQHRGAQAVGIEQPSDDLAVAAEAGDDDRRVLRLADLVGRAAPRRRAPGAARSSDRSAPAAAASAASTVPPPPPAAKPPRQRSRPIAQRLGRRRNRTRRPAPAAARTPAVRPAAAASAAPSPAAPPPSAAGSRRRWPPPGPGWPAPRRSRCSCPRR